jgi:hypothetical protein
MTRQAAALHAVQAFSLTPWGEAITGPDLLEQNIADLLADIAHLCDREKLSLPAIIARAQMHYEAENTTGTQFIL